MSCLTCTGIDPFGLIKDPWYEPEGPERFSTHLLYPYHDSLIALKESALQGCDFCNVVARVVNESVADNEGRFDDDDDDDDDDWEFTDRLYTLSTEADRTAEASLKASHAGLFHIVDKPTQERAIYLEVVIRDTFDVPRTRIIDLVICWEDDSWRKVDKLFIVAEMPDKLSNLVLNETVQTNKHTSSDFAFGLARYWLRECIQEHELCQAKRRENSRPLPSRVLDVGKSGEQEHLFLHISNGQVAPYVCLSHCWGTKPAFKTTTSSLESRTKSIPIDEMPQTFRDAVNITRQLGQQYLWIDSLCIIQDSESDWLRESAVMGDYYKSSLLTIFALAASGDTEGCFVTKPSAPLAVAEAPMFRLVMERILKLGPCKPLVQQKGQHIGHSREDMGQESVFDVVRRLAIESDRPCPLYDRAWTLQEQLLTTCSLNYSDYEVSWSCPAKRACECVPEGFGSSGKALESMSPLMRAYANESRDVSSMYSLWYDLVVMYTKRRLTYGKDKLPALEGIAREFSRIVKSDYLAGIWAGDIRAGLTWHIPWSRGKTESDKSSRSTAYRAPSWSWASINGLIRHEKAYLFGKDDASSGVGRSHPVDGNTLDIMSKEAEFLTLEAEILSYSVQSLSANSFGQVTGGTISLRGLLKYALVGPHRNTYPQNGLWIQVGSLSIFDCQSGEEVGGFEPDEASWNGTSVYCLPLRAKNGESKLLCLALEPVNAVCDDNDDKSDINDRRTFRRVGMIWMFGYRPPFESDRMIVRTNPFKWFGDTIQAEINIV